MNSFGWDNFWKQQDQSFNTVMKIGTTFFARQLERLLDIQPSDEILDYGCGPAFLADYFVSKQIPVTGVDINEAFLAQSRSRHPTALFITITTEVEINKSILNEHLSSKRFDFIILLSIVQYFKNEEEVQNVIRMLRHFFKKDGRLILADVVDENTSTVKDATSLLFQCVKSGKTPAFFRFVFHLMFSNYRKLSRNVKLLRLSKQTIQRIAVDNGLNCAQVDGLTIHPSRTNYIMTNIATSG